MITVKDLLLADNGKPIEETPTDDEQIYIVARNKRCQNPGLDSFRDDSEGGKGDEGR